MVKSKKVAAKKTKTLKDAAKKVAVKKPTTKQIKEALAVGDTAALGKMMKAEVGGKGRKLIAPVGGKKAPVKRVRKLKDKAFPADVAEAVTSLQESGVDAKLVRFIDPSEEAKVREAVRVVRAIADEPEDIAIDDNFVESVKQEVASGWTYPVYTDNNSAEKSVHRAEPVPFLKRVWNWISK